MLDEERAFTLEIFPQRYGNTYAIRRFDEPVVQFFAYCTVKTDASGESAILDDHGYATVYWNVSEHSGSVSKDQQRVLIVEVLEAFKFNWGRGVGRYGREDPVDVRVIFDAPNPN
jgi:hypothetical protein